VVQRFPSVTMSQIHAPIGLLFMTIRSLALFAHLLGMVALFAALAVEWLCVERLRAADEPRSRFSERLLERLPYVTGIAVGFILLSGIPMAVRIGVLRSAFVGMSFVGIVVMAALGRIALRPLLRGVKEARHSGRESVEALRQLASRPFLRASFEIRVWTALSIVFVMVAKPDFFQCTAVFAVALLVSTISRLARRRSRLTPAFSTDGTYHDARSVGGSQTS
jgi:hypothetical protein